MPVAPYEATIDDLKRQLRAKEVEAESLKEKLRSATLGTFGKERAALFPARGSDASLYPQPRFLEMAFRFRSNRCAGTATPELFEAYMDESEVCVQVPSAHLLSLMRSARWDIVAARQDHHRCRRRRRRRRRPLAIPDLEPRDTQVRPGVVP
ncbi:hypothetical protein C4D60_Mb10t16030 [Musa balbisiana]|uniref:Uncharacterized protein n=1 Tax=Musa balbisiana TaxID=52838 RepID=A0A4S8IXH7_MUSBA|nr:hypothetical protein C4D60_Mb10t16030 [Musa balbisiana]